MAKVYAILIEDGEKNFNTIKVSNEMKEKIRAIIISDGYTINEDGTVTKNEN